MIPYGRVALGGAGGDGLGAGLMSEDDASRLIEDVQRATYGVTLRDLRAFSDDEIVRRHDLHMDPMAGEGALGPEDYRAEVDRRVAERQTTWLIRLTWVIAFLTVIIAVATIALYLRGG
jgi:hypothetical protein